MHENIQITIGIQIRIFKGQLTSRITVANLMGRSVYIVHLIWEKVDMSLSSPFIEHTPCPGRFHIKVRNYIIHTKSPILTVLLISSRMLGIR